MIHLPYSNAVILTVLAFVTTIGGYGGYTVYKGDPEFGTQFESRGHIVTDVIDGDTIVVDDGVRVRLIGVDAPELDECYGEKAHKYLTRILLNREVELRKDIVAEDPYGRLLRYVFLISDDPRRDNLLINKHLVERGYAQAYYTRENNQYYKRISIAENKAVKRNRAMWRACKYQQRRVRNSDTQDSVASFDKDCRIKGNISQDDKASRYFVPGCQSYNRIKIDPSRGEKWFCTEKEAQAAGFTRGTQCPVVEVVK